MPEHDESLSPYAAPPPEPEPGPEITEAPRPAPAANAVTMDEVKDVLDHLWVSYPQLHDDGVLVDLRAKLEAED